MDGTKKILIYGGITLLVVCAFIYLPPSDLDFFDFRDLDPFEENSFLKFIRDIWG